MTGAGCASVGRGRRSGFTLVELLVVIGIIAVLIGVLLPVLGEARRQANTLSCLANLRSLGQAMAFYVADFDGALPGSGNTSGRHFFTASFGRVYNAGGASVPPGPVSPNDFIWPLAKQLKLPLNDTVSIAGRYQQYTKLSLFVDRQNLGFMSDAYTGGGGQNGGSQQVLGYVTMLGFLQMPVGKPGNATDYTKSDGGNRWVYPASYHPKITRVGKPAEKVFMADGSKFSTPTILISYNLDPYPDPNGSARSCSSNYTDYGPFTTSSTAYNRAAAISPASTQVDGRLDSFRHGARGAKRPTGSYKLNALFFDGHAETMGEKRALDPNLYLPSGTVISSNALIWSDVEKLYALKYPYTIK